MGDNTETRKLAAIMFTDMVGYSAVAQRNDKLALELLEEHRRLLREIFPRFRGSEIKTIGDAFLAEFNSALEAAQCGIEIQRTLAKRNHDVTAERRVELKIGIHIGDVVHRDGDVYGDGVNIASRIEPLAGAGGICVSMDVERQIRNALEARFEKLAPTELKNISVTMDLFRIVLPWETTVTKPASPAISLLPAEKPAVDPKSVAVLAFANLSGDKENEYFSDGISEELLNVLAKIPGLKVTARTSAFHFKGKDTPIPEIARQLGVAYVVEGSVRKSGGRVRITAQLIKAADGFHAWSDTFTRDLQDIFAVQDEIAGLIASNLQLRLSPTNRFLRAVNPEAHRLVLEGRYFWNRRTPQGFEQALELINQAITLDPDYPEAHAALADVLVTKGHFAAYAGQIYESDMRLARTEAQHALSLDPGLVEAHPALGVALACEGRFAEAEHEFRKVFTVNPNYALAHHWYALTLQLQGRLDTALAEIDRAVQLDPLSVAALLAHQWMLSNAGRLEESLAGSDRLVALRPDFSLVFAMRSVILLQLGRKQEAIAAARNAFQETINVLAHFQVSSISVLRQAGDESMAVTEGERLLGQLSADNCLRGVTLAALGRWEEAWPALERTPVVMRGMYFWDPMWDERRNDPRFGHLIAKLGCEKEYEVARTTQARLLRERTAGK